MVVVNIFIKIFTKTFTDVNALDELPLFCAYEIYEARKGFIRCR